MLASSLGNRRHTDVQNLHICHAEQLEILQSLSLPDTVRHFFSRSNLNSFNHQDYLAQLLHSAFSSSH